MKQLIALKGGMVFQKRRKDSILVKSGRWCFVTD
jgi:hypothetical protein